MSDVTVKSEINQNALSEPARSKYALAHCELCYTGKLASFRNLFLLPVTICSKCLKELWNSNPLPDAKTLLQEKTPGLLSLFEQEIIRMEEILPTIELKERGIYRRALIDANARLDVYQNHPEEIEQALAELISVIETSKTAGHSLRRFKKKHSFRFNWWTFFPKMIWECCIPRIKLWTT